jgi:hypothetical protein
LGAQGQWLLVNDEPVATGRVFPRSLNLFEQVSGHLVGCGALLGDQAAAR